jgi:ankyrin repeat protein
MRNGFYCYIEDVAADVIHQSDVDDEDLAELWDAALAAKFPPTVGRPEYRLGYIDKVEFFVLLSELQAKLEITIDVFFARLGHETAPSVASSDSPLPVVKRNNPFMGNVKSEVSLAPPRPPKAPINAPAPEVAHESNPRAEVGVSRELLVPKPAGHIASGIDGVDGSLQDFRISQAYPTSSSGVKKDEWTGINRTALKNATPDVNLPIPVVQIENEKIAYTQYAAPTSYLKEQNVPTDPHSSALIRATQETEVPIPLSTHFSSQKEVVPSTYELEAENPQLTEEGGGNSRHDSTLTGITYAGSQTGIYEMEALLSTKESDKLAIERVEALKCKEEQEKRDAKSSRMRIASVGKSLKTVLGKDPDKSASGYSLKVLAEALEAAASEGNVPLITSLLSLGANVVYSSIKNQTEHAALAMAAEKGHTRVVDVIIHRGSTQHQIDSALMKACRNHHMDLAIKLVQEYQANIYPKRHVHPGIRKNIIILSPSCFDSIAVRITDPQAPLKLLECFIRQKGFKINKIVLSIYRCNTCERQDFTALAVFVYCHWIEGVQVLLNAGASIHGQPTDSITTHPYIDSPVELSPKLSRYRCSKHSTPAICCLHASDWKHAPKATLALCQLLISAGSVVNITHTWTSDGLATTPLATAVEGGSLEGAELLLAHGADSESKSFYKREEYSVLGIATRLGRLDIVRTLVNAGAGAWKVAHGGYLALYIACEEGEMELVEYLLEVGANLGEEEGEMCLCVAAQRMRLSVVELLMRKGIPVSEKVLEAAMALPPAAQRLPEFLRLLDMLLDSRPRIYSGVIFEAINSDNHVGLARILSSGKASLAVRGDERCDFKWGYTPELHNRYKRLTCLTFARVVGKADFERLLESYGFKEGSE